MSQGSCARLLCTKMLEKMLVYKLITLLYIYKINILWIDSKTDQNETETCNIVSKHNLAQTCPPARELVSNVQKYSWRRADEAQQIHFRLFPLTPSRLIDCSLHPSELPLFSRTRICNNYTTYSYEFTCHKRQYATTLHRGLLQIQLYSLV